MGLGRIVVKALEISGEIVKWGFGCLAQEAAKYEDAKDTLDKRANHCRGNDDGLVNWDNERLIKEYKTSNQYEKAIIRQELKNRKNN